MVDTSAGTGRDNLRGILLMVAAMGGFALEDMFIKHAAAGRSAGEIMIMIGLTGAAIFAAITRRGGQRVFSRAALHPALLLRNLGELTGTVGFVTALVLTPLTTATAILQVSPLVVTFGAAVFLGETVGWRRWLAIGAGFVGVLIIIRPGLEGFRIESLWSVLAAVGLALRDLATRRIPATISTTLVSSWGFLSAALAGVLMIGFSGEARLPGLVQSSYVLGALAFGMAAYWAITQAMRLGEVSVIAPFRYSRLVFAMVIGLVIFGERPDLPTLTGAALIIGSGLYTFARERFRARLRKRSLSTPDGAG